MAEVISLSRPTSEGLQFCLQCLLAVNFLFEAIVHSLTLTRRKVKMTLVLLIYSIEMVRVKYRYIISVVSVGVPNSGAGSSSQGVRPAFPGYSVSFSSGSPDSNSEAILYKAIRRSMQAAHGSFGVGRMMTRFRIIYWNPLSGLLIIRVLRGLATEQMTSALSLITSVNDGG